MKIQNKNCQDTSLLPSPEPSPPRRGSSPASAQPCRTKTAKEPNRKRSNKTTTKTVNTLSPNTVKKRCKHNKCKKSTPLQFPWNAEVAVMAEWGRPAKAGTGGGNADDCRQRYAGRNLKLPSAQPATGNPADHCGAPRYRRSGRRLSPRPCRRKLANCEKHIAPTCRE